MSESEASVDDRFLALMEGLRTTLPGVQVLFGFLLAIPFQGAFADLVVSVKWVYYSAFLAASLASLLLIAPSVHQRVRGRQTGITRRHESHLRIAVNLAIAGSVLFLVSMTLSVYLVTVVIFEMNLAIVAVSIVGIAGLWSWFYLPIFEFSDDHSQRS